MRLKRYFWYHAVFLLFVALFAVYGYVAIVLLENRIFHCFMHDILRLYCPFCGGTRAFLSCLRLDFVSAFIYNSAAILFGLLFLLLDIRALILLIKGEQGPVLPAGLLPFSVCFFGAFFALRNMLALLGVDPVGDIAPFWAELATPVALMAGILLCLGTAFLCVALLWPRVSLRAPSAFLMGMFFVSAGALLYTPWLWLLLPIVAGGAFAWYLRKKRPLSLTAIKYGETTIPLRMAFADCRGCEERIPISLTLYLIETAGRKILVDAGCDTMKGYDVKHHISPAEALRRYGVDPGEITDLVLTHAHNDHAAATHYFTNATVHIAKAELDRARQKGFLPEGFKIAPFGSLRRIKGVTVRVWGGHSEGSSIVTLMHGGKKYVIAGDECYSKQCLAENRPTGSSYNKERSRAFVEIFGHGDCIVLLSHDPDILPGQNGHLTII